MIERLEVFVTELPVRVKRIFSSGAYDTGDSKEVLGKPVLLKVFADGIVGTSQIRPISPGHFVADTTQSVVAAVTEVYGPLLLGRSPFDLEAINYDMIQRLPGNPAARALIDICLHDWVGKAVQQPVYNLIGGRAQERIPLEWSVSLADEPQAMVAEARRAVEEFGIRVLCLKAADRRGMRQDIANFKAVRQALGPDIDIGIDPNTGWTVSDTIAALPVYREMGLAYLEQPNDRRDLRGLAEIRRAAAGIPVMADEALFTVDDAFAIAEARAADVFCMKLYKLGGLATAKKIAGIGEAAQIRVNCGGLAVQSQLEASAGAHFCASTPAKRMMGGAEFVFGLNTTAPDPLVEDTDFLIQDGHVSAPTTPGLGVIINDNKLQQHTLLRRVVHQ